MKASARAAAALAAALVLGPFLPSGCAQSPNGDTLVIAVESAPKSLDPRLGSTDGVAARIHQLIFDTLVRKNERFEIVPYLAESFEAAPDAKTFAFKLRHGVTFHKGQELTSADVKYTFDSILDPALASPVRAAFGRLESIETPDPYTVVFHARESYYGLLGDLVAIGIIRDGTSATQSDDPEGTGPFRVTDHDEQTVRLEAHTGYFGGTPAVKKLLVRVVTDNNTRELEIKSSGVDLAINTGFSPDAIAKMETDAGLRVFTSPGTNVDHVGINVQDETLRNPQVRQAIAYAIDRDQIIQTLLKGQARPADAVIPPESWFYETGIATYPHDVARAKALLDSAGFRDPDGDGPQPRFAIAFTTSSTGLAPAIGQIIQEQLRAVGIGVNLEQFERNTFFERINSGNYDLYYARSVGWNQTPDAFAYAYHSRYQDKDLDKAANTVRTASDPAAAQDAMSTMLAVFDKKAYCESREAAALIADARGADPATQRTKLLGAYDLISGRGGGNRSRLCDPALDDLIIRAERSPSRDEQRTMYSQVMKTVADAVPQVYLWYPANIVIATKRVGNVNVDPSGAWYFIKDVTLAQ